jgi:gliding motility-associated-like protein/uncharacterized repeat protein (TIGR01451 family)
LRNFKRLSIIRMSKLLRYLLSLCLFFLISNQLYAQNCSVNAGTDQTICPGTPFVLNGTSSSTLPLQSNPVWTQVAGPAVTLSNTTVAGTKATATVSNFAKNVSYTFRLTAKCQDGSTVSQDVKYMVSDISIANAGPDKTVCPGTVPLEGSPLGVGEIGKWTKISGTAEMPDPANPGSPTSNLIIPTSSGIQTATYRWTVTKGDCTTFDEVVIKNLGTQTVSAGADQLGLSCYNVTTSTTLNGSYAAADPASGQLGTWTFISGPSVPVFANKNQYNTGVSNLIQGSYTLRWTVTGPCKSGFDDMVITVDKATQNITSAGGSTAIYCDGRTSVVLTGPKASYANETVLWQKISGPGTQVIQSPTSNVTIVTGLNSAVNNNYVFRYTITNPVTGCVSNGTYNVQFRAAPAVNISNANPYFAACGENEVILNYTTQGGTKTEYALVSAPAGSAVEAIMGGINVFTTPVATGKPIIGFNKQGTYIIRYRRSTANTVGGCSDAYKDITIVISGNATPSNAGTKQVLACNVVQTSLAGNTPTNGIGKWSQVKGPNDATFDNVLSPTAKVTGLINGVYTFRWIISGGDGGCLNTQQDVDVVVSSNVPVAVAVGNATTTCYGTPFTLSGNTPQEHETGTWTVYKAGAIAPEVTFSDNHNPAAVATGLLANTAYTFRWTVANSCNTAFKEVVITTTATAGPKQATAGPDQCIAAPATSFTLAGNAPGTGETGTWTKLTGPGNPVFTANKYNTTVTGATTGTYTFQWSLSNGPCAATTAVVKITISAPPTPANAGPDQNICGGTAVLAANSPAIGQGTWTQTEGAGGVTITEPNNPNSSVIGLADGRYKFTWTITNGACVTANSDEVVLNVSSPSTLANAGADQTLCNQTNTILDANVITNGTGRWATVSGPTIPVFANLANPKTAVSNLSYGVYELEWISAGGLFCPPSSDKMTITVTQNANAGTNQTLCDVRTITLSGNANSVGTWANVSGPNTPTITPIENNGAIVSDLLTGTYVFKYTIPAIGTCPETSANVTYVISAPPTTADAGPDQAICSPTSVIADIQLAANTPNPGEGTGTWTVENQPAGSTATFSNAALPNSTFKPSVEGVYLLKWQIKNGNCTGATASSDFVRITVSLPPSTANAGADQSNLCSNNVNLSGNVPVYGLGTWTLVSGPNTPTINQPNSPATAVLNTIPGTYVFRWTIKNGVCNPSSDDVQIVVSSIPPKAANAGTDYSVCTTSIGGPANTTLSANAATGTEVGTWSVVGPAGATTVITAFNDPNTSVTLSKAGTYTFRWTLNNGSCLSFDEVVITAIDPPSVANITSGNQTICLYQPVNLTANAVTSGTGTWSTSQKPVGAPEPNFDQINGPATGVFGLLEGTYKFVFTTSNGICAQSAASPVTITIVAPPTASNSGSDKITCFNAPIALTANTPITGTGKWTVSSGQANTDYVFSDDTAPNSTFTGKVAGNYTLVWTVSNGSCISTSSSKVTVQPELINNTISTTTTTLCSDETVTFTGSTPTGGAGGYTYQWQRSTDGSPFVTIAGATGINYTSPALTNGTTVPIVYRYQRIVSSGNCAQLISTPITITVNPPISNNTLGTVNNNICFSGATGLITGSAPTGGSGTYTYQWQQSLNGAAFANIAGATAANYDPGTLSNNGPTINTYKYRRIVNSLTCSNISTEAIFTVNPRPVLTSGLNDVICSNTLFNYTPVINVTNATYTWTRAAVTGISNPTNSGTGAISETLINTTTSSKTVVYTFMLAANGCQNPTPFTVSVIVYPKPIGSNATITNLDCTGQFSYNLQDNINTSNAVPSNFSWTVAGNSNVSGQSNGSGSIISHALINHTTTVQQVVYTIIPTATTPGACPGQPFTLTVTVPVCPGMKITKTTTRTTDVTQVGDAIPYQIVVSNTANADQTNVVVRDPFLSNAALINPVKTGGNQDNILNKGETWTYSGTYMVTQADLDNNGKPVLNSGKITNTASVVSTELPGPQTAETTININAVSAYTVAKTSTTTQITTAGQIVPYNITVTNTGNTAISNVVISDPMLTNISLFSGDANANSKLDQGEIWIFTGSHVVTQAEIDSYGNVSPIPNGNLRNVVAVSGKKPDGTSVYPSPVTAEKLIPIVAAGSFDIRKKTTTTAITKVGQVVPYTITVANTGKVAISNLVVTDPLVTSLTLYSGDIAPANGKLDVNETWTYTGSYTATQADLNNHGKPTAASGLLSNVATASGKYPNGTTDNKISNTVTVPITPYGAYTIEKTADKTEINAASDLVTYTIAVKNTGDIALNTIKVTDPMLTLSLPAGDINADGKLDVNETWIYTGTYSVKQADIDQNGNTATKGVLSNTVTLNGKKPNGDSLDPLTSTKLIPLNTSSNFTVKKTADKTQVTAAGEPIIYTITVENKGTTAISNVQMSDPMLSNITGPGGDTNGNSKLDVNEIWIYKGTYTVSQDNINKQGNLCANGKLSNTANVTGNKPDGSSAGSVTALLDLPINPAASFSLTKNSNVSSVTKAGDLITYTVIAKNTGAVAINSLIVDDPMVNLIYQSGDTNTDGKLDLTESWTYTGTYTVSQADIDNNGNGTPKQLNNKVTATGRKPDGTLLPEVSASKLVNLNSNSSISVVKSTGITKVAKAGDRIPYTIVVNNTGSVAISNVVVNDPMLSSSALVLTQGDVNSNGKLDVNETWTYASTHVVTQTDIDNNGNGITAGKLVNQATVNGQSPNGALTPVTSNIVSTTIEGISSYKIEKSSPAASITIAGQQVPYTITVTNTGNTAISNVVVTDNMLAAGPLVLSSGDNNNNGKLDVTETWTYDSNYIVKQSDIDQNGNTSIKGILSNTASVSGTAPNGTAVDPLTSTRIIPLNTSSSFTVVKTADKASVTKAGDVVNYTITVTNTGDAAIRNVVVNDPMTGGNIAAVTNGDINSNSILDVAEVWVYRSSYTVTQADLDRNGNALSGGTATANGNLINTVTVNGTKPDGSSAGSVTTTNLVPIQPAASFSLSKTRDVAQVSKAGDQVVYTVTAKNTGAVAINTFAVKDPMVALNYQQGDTNGDGKLDVNETWIYKGTYTVTQSDIDNHGNGVTVGQLVNQVTAGGRKPDGSPLTEVTANATLDIKPTAAMTVKKASGTKSITKAGQVVSYAITVANTGTVAISNVIVNDPLLSGLSLYSGDVNGNGVMDVRETWTFTGTYTVTQADIDNFGMPVAKSGNLVNTATASGKLPDTNPINGTSNTVTIPIVLSPVYTIEKTSSTTEITAAGQQVPYQVTVTNTGDAAISDIILSDPMLSLTLTSGDANANSKLDVNEVWIYNGVYTVKQTDIDNNGNTTLKGVLTNTASLSGKAPNGTPVGILSSTVVIPLKTSTLFTVTKTADKAAVSAAGELINYNITITNTGSTAISAVKVNDPLLGGVLAAATSGDLNNNSILDVAETWIYTGTYQVTQADMDRNGNSLASNHAYANGNIMNIVGVSGNKPDGSSAGSVTAVNEVPITPVPVFTLTKTSNVAQVSKAGDVIVYTVTAKNTGTIAINTFVVNDPMLSLSAPTGDSNSNGKLDVNESWIYTGSYTVSQTDIDNNGNGIVAGQLLNTVTASGRKPDGSVTASVNATANVNVLPATSMKIAKSSTTTLVNIAGQLVPYSITVANTGTVAISNVVVQDAMLPNLTYSYGDVNGNNKLDVNETWTYTGSYTVSQADIDNQGNTALKGKLHNTASVSGNKPDGSSAGNISSTLDIPVQQTISVDFSKVTTGQVGYIAGQTVTYELKVSNTGNTTLKNIVVTDPNAAITNGSPIAQLNPGQQVLVTAVHTLTQADVDAGKVINQANLTGTDPNGNTITKKSDDPSTATPGDPTVTQIVSPGSITLVKTAKLSTDGNTIAYTFTVKNAGIVTLSNVTISDTKIAGAIAVNPSTLAPGQTGTASAVYTITAIEKAAEQVSNTAIVTGTSPNGFKVNDVSGTNENNNTPTLVILPKITGTKTVTDANANGIIDAGEVLTYIIKMTNNGGVDRTGVNVSDPIPANTTYLAGSVTNGGTISGNTINWTNLTVPANGSLSISFKVTVAADLPLGLTSIANIASIINPAQPASPIVVETNLPTAGKLESTKSVNDAKGNKDGIAQANEILTYQIEVKNSGGSTLAGVKISDVVPAGLTYVNASANNGGSFNTATNTLSWTADLTAGAVVTLSFDAKVAADVNKLPALKNTASILSPNGQTLQPEVTIATDPKADLVLSKRLLTPAPINTGDRIAYEITVVNTGQNKATGVLVTDVLPGTLDAPFDIVVAKGSSSYASSSKTLSWNIGELALNESVVITFKTRVVATGSLVNTAKVSGDQPDPTPDNNTASSGDSHIGGEDLLIPNLFTPNGDGSNDAFEIRGLDQFADNELVIVNRWGNEVFRASKYQNNWTGEGLNEGTYYYLLKAKKAGSTEWKVFKGYITLIRAFKK